MKKILFFIIVGLACNAMAQKPHKATGDKPLYSKSFDMGDNNDSICESTTYYTYDTEQRIVKTITHYSADDKDSTIYQYDQNGRITSINTYSDDELIASTVWVYNEAASRIDNYMIMEGMGPFLDTMAHTVYYGVEDMNATSEAMSLFDMDLAIRDCDSMLMFASMDGVGLIQMMAMYPVYQNGHPATAKLNINSELIAELSGMAIDLSINLTFTYSGQKLMTIKGSTTLDLSELDVPIPVPLSNFFTLTNQYIGDLLTETKSEIDVTVPIMGNMMYMGTKLNYLYNSEGNKICDIMYYSEETGIWDLELKTWYYYTNSVNVNVIESNVLSMSQNSPNPARNNTIINYSIPQDGEIIFNLFSINGQLLYNRRENASLGEHQINLDLSGYASGIYFYTMEYKGQRITKRMSVK